MTGERKLKVCLAASAGGHLNQLLVMEGAWKDKGYDCFIVTTGEMATERLAGSFPGRVYVLGESDHRHLLQVARALWGCARIIARERPDVVVSTGASHGCLLCLMGKLTGAKVVWVDSIANIVKLSMSGRMVRPFADVFLTQWPDLAPMYKGVEYLGELV